jgi:hypothetical protein
VETALTTPKKIRGVKRRKGASSRTGDKTSEQELMLVKSLKPSKKFAVVGTRVRSSSLSVGKKDSTVRTSSGLSLVTKGGAKRAHLASIEKDESGYVRLKRSLHR